MDFASSPSLLLPSPNAGGKLRQRKVWSTYHATDVTGKNEVLIAVSVKSCLVHGWYLEVAGGGVPSTHSLETRLSPLGEKNEAGGEPMEDLDHVLHAMSN